ncbi:cytochrome b [Shewanella sp. 202IG2-18]|uniref:cytochrome b n=1 Tax=Parashewanella hymeniacidonis TaxID=2807618 RepID=UPI0019619789|nr:cytochrome b [Parashewanella hymeniacidonis]MBM7072561.1 cytochrome b [Parashewanella hymeniacidonis]
MQLKNTHSRYGLIAISLHWLMALSIFGLFGLGLYMVELSYYDEWYRGSLELHKAMGVMVIGVLALRIIWRYYSKPPADIKSNSAVVNKAAKLAHRLLYAILATLLISGYLISTADGRSIDVFGVFEVMAMPSMHEQQEDIAGIIHWGLAWTLISLVALHAAAALKHHFIDKDETLKRILP